MYIDLAEIGRILVWGLVIYFTVSVLLALFSGLTDATANTISRFCEKVVWGVKNPRLATSQATYLSYVFLKSLLLILLSIGLYLGGGFILTLIFSSAAIRWFGLDVDHIIFVLLPCFGISMLVARYTSIYAYPVVYLSKLLATKSERPQADRLD